MNNEGMICKICNLLIFMSSLQSVILIAAFIFRLAYSVRPCTLLSQVMNIIKCDIKIIINLPEK